MDKLLQLGIDWQSILIYIVNFGVIFYLVGKYLVPGLLKALDERRNTIEKSINEANLLKEEFQKKLAEMQSEKEEARITLLAQMEEMKKSMAEKQAELIAAMEAEKHAMLDKAQKEIEERKTMLLKEAEEHMLELIKKIVLYIVQNKVPEDVVGQSIQDAWGQYKK